MEAKGEVDLSSSARACTENYLNWDQSPEQIRWKSDELIVKTKKAFDAVASLDLDGVTLNNTVKALAGMEAEQTTQCMVFNICRTLSPNKEVRNASVDACKKQSELLIDISTRKDVYQRVLALAMKLDDGSLTEEDKRYLHMRHGVRVKDLQDEMKLSSKYISNLHSHITKTGTYKGSPGGLWIEALGMKVDAKSLTEVYMKTYKQHRDTRRLHLRQDKQNKLKDIERKLINQDKLPIRQVLKLRAEKSALLGFRTYADYVLKGNMARSANKVSNFLDGLTRKRRRQRDEDTGTYATGKHQLKQYFPLEVVTQGMLDIFQDLLGLSFSLVHGGPVWHPDVTLYCVTDRSSGQTVGQFYLDLFARKGKCTNWSRLAAGCCVPLQPGCLLSDGSRQKAVVAIVTTFRKPTAGPYLLTHDNVRTLFHEFGHALHYLSAQVDYAVLSAFHVEGDFMEAPSQMLENWVWEKEPLQRISKHYRTGAPIPDDLLENLMKSRPAFTSRDVQGKLKLAILDQRIHTQTAPRDLRVGALASLGTNILNILRGEHYCYLWSEALAMDMFYSRFKQEGIMNPKVGLDYRNCILKPGASKDAKQMLRNFLGREPNQKAFLQSTELKVWKPHSKSWRKVSTSKLRKRKTTHSVRNSRIGSFRKVSTSKLRKRKTARSVRTSRSRFLSKVSTSKLRKKKTRRSVRNPRSGSLRKVSTSKLRKTTRSVRKSRRRA